MLYEYNDFARKVEVGRWWWSSEKKKPEASYDPRQSESSKNWTTNYGKHLDFIAILTSITYHLISHHHHPITQTGPSAHLFVLEVMGFDGTAVDPMLPLIPVTELIMSLLLKIAFHGGNFTGWKIWSHFKSLGIENPRGGLEDFQLIEGFMFLAFSGRGRTSPHLLTWGSWVM